MAIDPADLWVAADEDFHDLVLERAYADNPAQCPLSADEDDPSCSLIHFAQGAWRWYTMTSGGCCPCTTQGGDRYSARRRHRRRLRGQARTRELQEDVPEHPALCHAAGPRPKARPIPAANGCVVADRRPPSPRRLFPGTFPRTRTTSVLIDERVDVDDTRIYVHSDRHTALCDARGPVQGGSRCHVRPTTVREDGVLRQPTSRKVEAGVPRRLADVAEAPPEIRQVRSRLSSSQSNETNETNGHTTVDEVHEADDGGDDKHLHFPSTAREESGAAHLARRWTDSPASAGPGGSSRLLASPRGERRPSRRCGCVRSSSAACATSRRTFVSSGGASPSWRRRRTSSACARRLWRLRNGRRPRTEETEAGSILRRVSSACRVRKELNQLHHGAVEALEDQTTWLGRIADVPTERLFVAGDADLSASTSMFIPSGFRVGDLFARCRGVCEREFPRMMRVLRDEGWPTHLGQARRGEANGDELQGDGVSGLRAGSRACGSIDSYASRAKSTSVSSSDGALTANRARRPSVRTRIGVSCAIRGRAPSAGSSEATGRNVSRLRKILIPDLTYLDWDRTVCTTRSGASPLKGTHAVDPDLLSMICSRPKGSVHIVTRNSYRDDIKTFMARAGLPDDIPVHTVKKHQSKAEVILEGNEGTILFVDDSVAEHMDERLMRSGVFRVLFGRALS